jgi:small-conductance mechanosensitive channel
MEPREAEASAAAARQTERRIAWLTLAIGAMAGVAALFLRHVAWAAGLFVGTALGWLNFRWLRRGLDSLVAAAAAQAGRGKPKVPLSSYFLPLLRYALLGLTVYVIFEYLHIPLASMVVGLCALGAAAIAASVYEIWHPVE